jgi:N utilization substance protein B
MEFSPQKLREIVFQLLFSLDGSGSPEAELIPFLMQELAVSKKYVKTAYQKALLIWEQRDILDSIIQERTKEYALDRIKTVEKNVLRLAFYELLIEKELNKKIIISEAHRLARKFSTVEGAAFVNALLDSTRTQDDGSSVSTSKTDSPQ